MTQQNRINSLMQALVVGAVVSFATSVLAVDVFTAAKAYTKTMPDGSTVPMWGYVDDPGGVCYFTGFTGTNPNQVPLATAPDPARQACIDGLGTPTSPGDRIELGVGQVNLRIFLSNGLSEPTSLVITGQELPFSRGNNGPTWDDDSIGGRGADMDKRVRSYGREAVAEGGNERYMWTTFQSNPISPGSYILHSGTHPQKQVYMGLYAAMTQRAANAGGFQQVYDGVPYDNEVVLFYSEIDPAQNAAVAAGTYTTSIYYHARWFLINGEPYDVGMPDIEAGVVGDRTLLRLFSTAGETHVPTLNGLYMNLHAEDGQRYNWQDSLGLETPAPRTQYTAMLPPLKTKDAIITATDSGRYAVYDGNGYMTNPTDTTDFLVGDTIGGMLRFLNYSAVLPSPGEDDLTDFELGIGGGVGGAFSSGSNSSGSQSGKNQMVNPVQPPAQPRP